nr:MAG TPA: hypothetical protein [Caudoviricetes sp.]
MYLCHKYPLQLKFHIEGKGKLHIVILLLHIHCFNCNKIPLCIDQPHFGKFCFGLFILRDNNYESRRCLHREGDRLLYRIPANLMRQSLLFHIWGNRLPAFVYPAVPQGDKGDRRDCVNYAGR